MPAWTRIAVHADMDAFYAAAEQLDDPSLRGKPIIVGPRSRRGVVLTASYEARPFGVGSAMPMARAMRLCPDAIVVPPRMDRYQELSAIIMKVFSDFSPCVEALSLDEAFIDMTGAERIFGPPEEMGTAIKAAVREATGGLVVSVGVSGTKYVAKVASAGCKPDGMLVVPPWQAREWLAPQPVSRLWGAGPKTQARLNQLGFQTIGDVAAADPNTVVAGLGKIGNRFSALARAIDPRRVEGSRRARSVGSERTLGRDIHERADILEHVRRSADAISRRLRRKATLAWGVRVKLKTARFKSLSRQTRLFAPTDIGDTLFREASALLDRFEDPGPFRLVGLAAYDLVKRTSAELPASASNAQLELALDPNLPPSDVAARGERQQRRIEVTLDNVTERFGRSVIGRGTDISRGSKLGPSVIAPNLDFLDD